MPKQPALIADILTQLETLGDDKVRARNKKLGAGEKQYGVPLGELRKVAKKLKSGRELALALWKTRNLDARLLAILLLKPKDLTAAELDRMVREASFAQLADWLNAYIVKNHADRETLRQTWMQDADPWAARAGWNLTAARIANDHTGLDIPVLLDRIEKEMPTAPAATQWTMNNTLGAIGIHHPQHRKRAIAIGEKIGLYKDWPVSRGCIPPYVPVWVEEMVRRQG